jgi:hypothetical protein
LSRSKKQQGQHGTILVINGRRYDLVKVDGVLPFGDCTQLNLAGGGIYEPLDPRILEIRCISHLSLPLESQSTFAFDNEFESRPARDLKSACQNQYMRAGSLAKFYLATPNKLDEATAQQQIRSSLENGRGRTLF